MSEYNHYKSIDLDPSKWMNSVSAQEASEYLGISADQLLEWAHAKICPHYTINEGSPRFI